MRCINIKPSKTKKWSGGPKSKTYYPYLYNYFVVKITKFLKWTFMDLLLKSILFFYFEKIGKSLLLLRVSDRSDTQTYNSDFIGLISTN